MNAREQATGAAEVRARVRDSLKQTVERAVLEPETWMGFSRVEHVVEASTPTGPPDEELLCIGDLNSEEEKFRRFVGLLTEAGELEPSRA